jgi:copper chaperone CopZ
MPATEKFSLELPAMYADHHVLEVRRILLETPGVSDVYASSAFHVVEATYDPEKASSEQFKAKLAEAGYLGDMDIPVETGAVRQGDGNTAYFRHTAVFEQVRQGVSFGQNVSYTGRPLWQCPGLGVIKKMED